MSTFDLSQQLSSLNEYFSEQPLVVLAYLFGSQARGKGHALSDIDIAVLLEANLEGQKRLDIRLQLMVELEKLSDSDDVDIVVLNEAPPALRYRVLRDGKLLFCKDSDQCSQFYLRTVNEYLDFKPILERHEKAIIEKAKKGALLSGYNPHRGALEHHRAVRERLKGT